MAQDYERARERRISPARAGNATGGGNSGEGRMPPIPRLHYDGIIASVLLDPYIDLASRMREAGVGDISVTRAEEQVSAVGPLNNPDLVAATFDGQQKSVEDFRSIAYGINGILNPITGIRRFEGDAEKEEVEKVIQSGIDSLVARKRHLEAMMEQFRNRQR